MRINYNVSAMLSNNALANNDSLLARSLQRLSSGLKINHAKDNPAGLAMAKRMDAQISGLSIANQNASDGVSIIETADGALQEVSEMLQRINELAIKAANGTMVDEDRETIQAEVRQLKEEITRISDTTEFNAQPLLNGEFSYKGFTNQNDVKVNSYTGDVTVREYTISQIDVTQNAEGEYEVTVGYGDGFDVVGGKRAAIQDDLLVIRGDNGFEMKLDISNTDLLPAGNSYTDEIKIDITGIGPMRLQIGSNEGQVLEVDIPAVTLQNLGIENIDLSTKEGADDAIERVSEAIDRLSAIRGRLGAYQNRLESTINSLDVTSENMTSAYSRIMDVDMAEEMTQYTTNQVLTQAGTSMLAQANERPSQVLQLLQ